MKRGLNALSRKCLVVRMCGCLLAVSLFVYACVCLSMFLCVEGASESVRVCRMASKNLCHSSTCNVFRGSVYANKLVKTIMDGRSLEITFSYMRNFRICVIHVNQSCKPGFSGCLGFDPGSGISLSKYFEPISGLHTKLVNNIKSNNIFFPDVHLLFSPMWLLWVKWLRFCFSLFYMQTLLSYFVLCSN